MGSQSSRDEIDDLTDKMFTTAFKFPCMEEKELHESYEQLRSECRAMSKKHRCGNKEDFAALCRLRAMRSLMIADRYRREDCPQQVTHANYEKILKPK